MTEVTMLPVADVASSDPTDGFSSSNRLWQCEIPRFIGRPLDLHPEPDVLRPNSAIVCLWRLRTEWKSVSRIDGMASLSRAEAARVARFPKSPQSKRFAVERASLREILSGLTGRNAAEIELSEHPDGQVKLAPQQGNLSIAIAHVGLWTVIGVSRSRIGLASAVAGYRSNDTRRTTQDGYSARAHVRLSSLLRAGITLEPQDLPGPLLGDPHQAYLLDARSEGRWQVSDLPMAGSNLLSLAAPYPIEKVHGYGWASSSGYALTR